MADNTQDCPFPSPRLPVSGVPLERLGGYKPALALGMIGAGTAGLFFCAHWSIAIVGAVVALALSVSGSEPFILFIIFLTPLAATLKMGEGRFDGPSALHFLVIAGFFLGRFGGGRVGVKGLLSSSPARASLFLFGAMFASIIFGECRVDGYSAHSLYRMGVVCRVLLSGLSVGGFARTSTRKFSACCSIPRSQRPFLQFCKKSWVGILPSGCTSIRQAVRFGGGRGVPIVPELLQLPRRLS